MPRPNDLPSTSQNTPDPPSPPRPANQIGSRLVGPRILLEWNHMSSISHTIGVGAVGGAHWNASLGLVRPQRPESQMVVIRPRSGFSRVWAVSWFKGGRRFKPVCTWLFWFSSCVLIETCLSMILINMMKNTMCVAALTVSVCVCFTILVTYIVRTFWLVLIKSPHKETSSDQIQSTMQVSANDPRSILSGQWYQCSWLAYWRGVLWS